MILSILMMLDGLKRFKTLEAWRYSFFGLMWIFVVGNIATVFFAAGGTLENPAGDGLITAHIRKTSNDGSIVAITGLATLIAVYIPFLWLWAKAGRARKQADSDSYEEDLSQEDGYKFAKLTQVVNFKCKFALNIVEDMDGSGSERDITAKKQFESYIKTCLSQVEEIEDEFFKSSAIHPIVELLAKAGEHERANELIELISVDFIQEKAKKTLG